MTDEERQKLCKELRRPSFHPTEFIRKQAANEIERLAAELKQVESENEHHIRLAFVDAGANPARAWKEEAERLASIVADYKMVFGDIHEPFGDIHEVMGVGITHEASHTDTENGEKSNAESEN